VARLEVKFDGPAHQILVREYKRSGLSHLSPLSLLHQHPLLENHTILFDHLFFHHWSSFIIHHHHPSHPSSTSSIFINHWHCLSSTTTASHHAHFISHHAQRFSTMRTTTFRRVFCLCASRLMDQQHLLHILGIECLLLHHHRSTIFNFHHKPSTPFINKAHQHQDLFSKDLLLLVHLGKFFAHVYHLFTSSHIMRRRFNQLFINSQIVTFTEHLTLRARAHPDATCLRTHQLFQK